MLDKQKKIECFSWTNGFKKDMTVMVMMMSMVMMVAMVMVGY